MTCSNCGYEKCPLEANFCDCNPSDMNSFKIATWQHEANEWADVATNGLQLLKNVRDGIITIAEAIEDMEVDIINNRTNLKNLREKDLVKK